MFSSILLTLAKAHTTFQSPMMWNTKKKGFVIDKSPGYWIISRLILLLDIVAIPAILIGAVGNYALGLSYPFTIVILFVLAPAAQNIVYDITTFRKEQESLQLLNAFSNLLNSKGKYWHWCKTVSTNPKIFFVFFTGKEYNEICERLDDINNKLFQISTVSMMGLSLLIPLLFYRHLVVLVKGCNAELHLILGFHFPSIIETPFCILVAALFVLIMYLTTYKWMMYGTQMISIIYLISLWLKPPKIQTRFLKVTLLEMITFYQSLYIFTGMWNEAFCVPLFCYLIVTTVTCSIAFTMCLLQGFSFLTLSLFTVSVVLMIFLNMLLKCSSSVNHISEKYIESIRSEETSGVSSKFAASLRRSRIYSGSIYFIDRDVLLTANDAIIQNAISIVLSFK